MTLIRIANHNDDVGFYLNSNKTMLYCHIKSNDKLGRFYSDKWASQHLEVVVINEKTGCEEYKTLDIKSIISGENDFIKVVQSISSTVQPKAYFERVNEFGLRESFFNEFLGSGIFLDAKKKNKFGDAKDPIKLLKTHAPAFNILLRNIFYGESDIVIKNFLSWLNVAAFEDRHQDVLWCFFGTTESMQGQGAGKGILMEFLTKLYSGLTITLTNSTYDNDFNGDMLNKKIVVFDEVSMKHLKWDKVKDSTGRSTQRVEFKGKDAITADNVASWLLFTNEYELAKEITQRDRRAFLINPNPTNESLMPIIKRKFGGYDEFMRILIGESENIVHIIERAKGVVIKPLKLKTNAHKNYWKARLEVDVKDLYGYQNILVKKGLIRKLLGVIGSNEIEFDDRIATILKSNCINYKIFLILFEILTEIGVVKKGDSPLLAWERTKENILKNDFVLLKIDMAKTKKYQRFTDKTFLHSKKISSNKLRDIKKLIRELQGVEVTK